MNITNQRARAVGRIDCPICLEDIEKPREIIITNCKHYFCEPCITNHAKINSDTPKCPLCRQSFLPMVRSEESPNAVEENPYIESTIVAAVRKNDLHFIIEAVASDPSILTKKHRNAQSDTNCSLLMLAAELNSVDMVVFLLGQAEVSLETKDEQGSTALMLAVKNGHLETIKLLLGANANVNAVDNKKQNVLHLACCYGHVGIVKMLIEEFDLPTTSLSDEMKTPLYISARNGHTEIVELLIKSIPKKELKTQINHHISIEGATPLFIAAQYGHADIVSILVKSGGDPNERISLNRTPLTVSSAAGYLGVAQILIAAGANVDARQSDGSTALYLAAGRGHREMVELLLRAKANKALGFKPYYLDSTTVTPEDIAAQNGYEGIANLIASHSM